MKTNETENKTDRNKKENGKPNYSSRVRKAKTNIKNLSKKRNKIHENKMGNIVACCIATLRWYCVEDKKWNEKNIQNKNEEKSCYNRSI